MSDLCCTRTCEWRGRMEALERLLEGEVAAARRAKRNCVALFFSSRATRQQPSRPSPRGYNRPPMSTDTSPASAESHPGFWRIVLLALQGKQYDYTSESLNRAVLLLAVPMVLEMIMESLFAVVDVFWVSRLGKEAVAVIGLTESVMTLIYAVAIGISFAATAIVARRIGERTASVPRRRPGRSSFSASLCQRAWACCSASSLATF